MNHQRSIGFTLPPNNPNSCVRVDRNPNQHAPGDTLCPLHFGASKHQWTSYARHKRWWRAIMSYIKLGAPHPRRRRPDHSLYLIWLGESCVELIWSGHACGAVERAINYELDYYTAIKCGAEKQRLMMMKMECGWWAENSAPNECIYGRCVGRDLCIFRDVCFDKCIAMAKALHEICLDGSRLPF